MTSMDSASNAINIKRLGCNVQTSSKIIHRGSKFNVHISIQNYFDKSIKIIGHSWQLPPGLSFEGESPGNEDIKELQPGDSASLVFIIQAHGIFSIAKKSTNSENFNLKQPTAQVGENLILFNLSYEKEGSKHWQEIQTFLNIHAAPIEIYIAAVIAAIVSSFIRTQTLGYENALSGILGFFLVLIAKRKSDVQLGISIEDWVGGAVAGFFIGYLGTEFFDKFLTP